MTKNDTWDELRAKRDETVNHALEVAIDLNVRPSDDKTLTNVRVSLFRALVALANQYAIRMEEIDKREAEKGDLAIGKQDA